MGISLVNAFLDLRIVGINEAKVPTSAEAITAPVLSSVTKTYVTIEPKIVNKINNRLL
ncbi:hypothetical protein [Gillisia marina]|uniref:hypothetical protein n=1 Tax=Gillisia marina TaxID=1167637 RepID=UPI0012DE2757|nr:hypothetical protein [Gillisia marina]